MSAKKSEVEAEEKETIPPTPESVEGVSDEVAEPVKRKRGRPPKNPDAPSPGGKSGSSKSSSSGPRRKNAKPVDIKAFAKQLAGIHVIAGMISGIPEIVINEDEAEILAVAVVDICDEYGLAIDGKTGATLQLIGAVSMIYGPKAFQFYIRKIQEQQKKGMVVDGEFTANPAG